MKILTLSGSSRVNSVNIQLLEAIASLFTEHHFHYYEKLTKLPVFDTNQDQAPWSAEVINWRNAVKAADALIITSPEYLHNLPAKLKNAFEWLATSGELRQKPILAITFTPHPPRGEKAMQSLLWSLQALDARIVGQLPLYQNEIKVEDGILVAAAEILEMLHEAVDLLG